MKIVALIVTFNRLEKLKTTIEKSLAQPFSDIVVINNASSDGTKEWLEKIESSRVIALHLEENKGGAGGFKYGSEWISRNLSCDWILFYDDDAYPCEDFYQQLVSQSIVDECAYACKVVDLENNICKMNVPWKIYPKTFSETLKYIRNPTAYVASTQSNKSQEIFSLSFVGMLISHKMLNEHYTKINDKLFIYFDDVYFSYHLILNGIKLSYLPKLVMKHDVSNNTAAIPSWKLYYLIRNMILSRNEFGITSPFSKVFIAARLIKYILLSLKQKNKYQNLLAVLKGFHDGIFGHKIK